MFEIAMYSGGNTALITMINSYFENYPGEVVHVCMQLRQPTLWVNITH